MAVVQELVYEMAFKFQQRVFDKFELSIKTVTTSLMKMGTVAVASTAYMNMTASRVAKETIGLDNLAKSLNITTKAYQKLNYSSRQLGMSNGAIDGMISTLARVKEDMLLGQGDMMAWGQLGIDPRAYSDAESLLLGVSDALGSIESVSRRINIMERLGLSSEMLPLLEKGSAEIKAMGKFYQDVGALKTAEDKKWAKAYTKVTNQIGAIQDGVMNKMGTEFMKYLVPMLEAFSKFWQDNRETIDKTIKKIVNIFQKFSSVVGNIFKHILKTGSGLVKLMGGIEQAVMAVGLALVIFKARAIGAFLASVAPAVLLYIAIDDIIKLFNDPKNSAIGNFFNIDESDMAKLKALPNIFETIGRIMATVVEGWGYIFKGIEGLYKWLNGEDDTVSDAKDKRVNTAERLKPKKGTVGYMSYDEILSTEMNGGVTTGAGGYTKTVNRGMSLDMISKMEGTSDRHARGAGFASGYDMPFGGKRFVQPHKPLTSMTLDEVYAYQAKLVNATRGTLGKGKEGLGTSAVGKYQFINPTLRKNARKLGMNGNTIFNKHNQDLLGNSELQSVVNSGTPLGDVWEGAKFYKGGKHGGQVGVTRSKPQASATPQAIRVEVALAEGLVQTNINQTAFARASNRGYVQPTVYKT